MWVLAAIFPHFWPQNKPILRSLAVFLIKLSERPSVFLDPVYDWKMPILQSGELLKQNLMSKIEPAKLTTKMQLIDL